ncbi:mavicyanin-like [Triticum dicoccoides]|uniref:mavicyanin-like n=1 Tax=Triticum dicoccoides TaxID=85692 RepID=UPI000E7AF3EC|nr:mavicyanin-like [Triticum dicoccoides]
MASKALLLAVAVAVAVAAGCADATDHIVGANRGWNPNINYSGWSANQTFYAGDLISFRYQKGTHNVFAVNETGYDNCTMAGVTGNWTSGKDFIPLPDPGTYFFICGNGFCQAGMKVAITVAPGIFDLGPQIYPPPAPGADNPSASFTAGAWPAAAAVVTALGAAAIIAL